MKIEQLQNICQKMLNYQGTTLANLAEIEQRLNIHLPSDFKTIATFYDGGHFSLINDFSLGLDKQPNIIEETSHLRQDIKLPTNFILLAKPGESFILLDTENTPHIIWCNAKDISNLASYNFQTTPYTRKTYADFFEEMLRVEYQKYIEKKTEELQQQKQAK